MDDYDCSNLKNLLAIWNSVHFYDKLKEQRITVDNLKILKPTHIEKLIAEFPIGDQAVFEDNLEKWKNQTNLVSTTVLNTSSSHPQTPERKNVAVSVMEILCNTYNGKEILSFYGKNNILHEEQRNLLISTITKYIEARGIECSVSGCLELEKEICSIFPTEELAFYTNGKRGKIYNKLAYLKRLAKDVLKKDEIISHLETEPELEDFSFCIQQIKSEFIRTDEFDLYWRKCAPIRFKQISEANSTAEILNLWPEYIKPSGFQLIDIDFCLKFPNAKSIHDRWSQFGEKIVYLLKSKITSSYVSKQLKNLESSDEEAKVLMSFWYIHNLFPPQQKVLADSSGSKIRKKYTILDSQEGFALIVATKEELDAKLNLLKLQCRNIQPKLLIVGEICNIKDIYVYIDDIKYPILTILNAIDILFKIFFVFNLQYPEESDVFYNFVESFMYDLPTTKKYAKVSTVKHDILNLKI